MATLKNAIFLVLWLAVIGAGIFLGRWQLDRLVWKEGLLNQIDQAYRNMPAENLAEAQGKVMTGGFARVRITLNFDPKSRWFIEPRVHNEIVGAYVYELGTMPDGRQTLWVNRGFVPKEKMSVVQDAPRSTNLILQLITPPPSYGRMTDVSGKGYSFLYKNMGDPPVIGIVESSGADKIFYPIAIGARFDLPNNHLQYAIFWLGMSGIATLFGAVVIVRSVLLNRRRVSVL